MATYKITAIGNGKVLVNGNDTVLIQSFMQRLLDDDKRINTSTAFAYNGE